MLRMQSGNLFAVLALLVWGVWGVCSKLATMHIRPTSAVVYEVLGGAMVALIVFIALGLRLETNVRGMVFALATGICMSLGALLFLVALSRGNASTVTMIASLYPLVTLVLLFLILGEPVTTRQLLGVLLGMCALVLLVA